jgi:hypothetical protein
MPRTGSHLAKPVAFGATLILLIGFAEIIAYTRDRRDRRH